MAPENKVYALFEKMYDCYGPQHWWPGDTPWEICVGAVLTQNTSWNNVEKAIANLKASDSLCPKAIVKMRSAALAEAIRPSGYFNLKSERLKNTARWWLENVREDRLFPEKTSLADWRESLLSVNGIGPETADSILLYSFNMPVFVIDAYTKRIMARHFGSPADIGYSELQEIFHRELPEDVSLFNEFHALFVRAGKEHCRKSACLPGCPLR